MILRKKRITYVDSVSGWRGLGCVVGDNKSGKFVKKSYIFLKTYIHLKKMKLKCSRIQINELTANKFNLTSTNNYFTFIDVKCDLK